MPVQEVIARLPVRVLRNRHQAVNIGRDEKAVCVELLQDLGKTTRALRVDKVTATSRCASLCQHSFSANTVGIVGELLGVDDTRAVIGLNLNLTPAEVKRV